jgi:hypothetical protein
MSKINFANLGKQDKIDVLNQASIKTGIPAYAVEKDWWVNLVLKVLFDMEIGNHLVFKGGTSLSKAWKLIERFSEDIDLAIDRNFLGFSGELSKKERTKLRKRTSEYLESSFLPLFINNLKVLKIRGLNIKIIKPLSIDQDPRIIEVYYPTVIDSPRYIKPRIQIEIGCRSLKEPFTIKPLSTIIYEQFPTSVFAEETIKIPCVNPERTFLEKVFLLHEEFQRPKEKIRVDRLSRHLYDIYQLDKVGFAQKAMNDKSLYETIVKHRVIFTKVGGVNYQLHQPQTINPIPPNHLIAQWEADYKIMQEQMIYGDSPYFVEMMNRIQSIKEMINEIGWTINI